MAPGSTNSILNDHRVRLLGEQYFADTWRSDPSAASRAGVHDYDNQLGDFSAAAYGERIARTKRYLAQIEGIDPATLGAEASYDAQIFRSRLQSTLITLETRESWRHEPSLYTRAAANSVYSLLTRDFAPLAVRLRSVIARERAIPAMLAEAKRNVTTVDPMTAQIERQDVAGAAGFFINVVPAAVAGVNDPAAQAEFKTVNDAAIAALRDFAATMDAGPFAHPVGSFAIGSQLFVKMLALQELRPISLAEYERVGDAALAETKAEFIAIAGRIDRSKTPQQVADALGADHPAADGLLKKAADDLGALRAFVTAHQLLTLPPDDNVKVVPTPEFARQTSFASMNSPGPLERVATEAYYNVTPVEPTWSPARQAQHLAFFNNFAFPIISLHEVMPGHYVNFAIAKHLDLSLIRRLMPSPSFSEGWAHYGEQMMVDEGWGNGDPRVRLAQLQKALQRECRYLVGLREHTQGMTIAQATQFFQDNAFMGQEPAHREALRGTQDPLYGYYTLGKLEILKLRADYKKKLGTAFTLRRFHDELLAHGDPPLAIVRKSMLGPSDDGKLL